MPQWKMVGMDALVGGGAGIADQLIQNLDEKRGLKLAAEEPGKLDKNGKLPLLKQYGTILNYVVPAGIVVAVAMNAVKGDMATRLVTAGAQLAARKATHQMSTRAKSGAPSAAYSQLLRARAAAEAARQAAAEHANYEVQNSSDILV